MESFAPFSKTKIDESDKETDNRNPHPNTPMHLFIFFKKR